MKTLTIRKWHKSLKKLSNSFKIIWHSQKNKFPLKKDFKIKCNLETKIKKPVEPRKKVRNMTALDANIIFTKAPLIQYQQFKLKRNFK